MLMKSSILRQKQAFSLVEVVVAVGIFALAIVGVIGLLSPTNKAIADVTDSDNATRVVNAVQAELQRIASTSTGWATFTTSTTPPRLLRLSSEIATDDANTSFNYSSPSSLYILFASKDGSKIGVYNSTVWDVAGLTTQKQKDANKFFEIALIRNWDSTASTGLSDPTKDSSAGFLAYTMRIRWPVFLPDGTQFKGNAQKSVMIIPGAVTR